MGGSTKAMLYLGDLCLMIFVFVDVCSCNSEVFVCLWLQQKFADRAQQASSGACWPGLHTANRYVKK